MKQMNMQKAIDYKKNIANKFMLIEGAKIRSRLMGEEFYVTKKIDGHLQCLFYKDGQSYMLNSNGKECATDLDCLDTFSRKMQQSGVQSAMLAAELYLPCANGRPRCGDVARALASTTLKKQLALAVFDIIEIDGEKVDYANYHQKHVRLLELFKQDSSLCHAVEMRCACGTTEVQMIYDEWVVKEGAEGLVVHSDAHVIAKIKPRHTIDAAVVGYTIGDKGVRDLMLAVAHPDMRMQMFAVGSTGLTEQMRCEMAEQLSGMHVESQYVVSDSRGVAYQMVKPVIVVEVSVIELVAKGGDDKVKTNPILQYDNQEGWTMLNMQSGVSALGLTIEKVRTDKTVNSVDVRVSQLSDICPFEEQDTAIGKLQQSTMLERKVYRKISGDKVMVHKFLVWKTNKEMTDQYPAYVFYHVDYSSSRKEILKRDMAYSSSEEQIREILQREINDNIKKGWEEVV